MIVVRDTTFRGSNRVHTLREKVQQFQQSNPAKKWSNALILSTCIGELEFFSNVSTENNVPTNGINSNLRLDGK